MADDERPGGMGRDGAERAGLTAGLRVYRGGRVRRGMPRTPMPPGEIADRLTALERRVEEALAAAGERVDRDLLGTVVDGALTAVAGAQRWNVRDTAERLRTVDWTALFEEPARRVAPLTAAVVRAAYHYWWRVEMVGLDRVPRHGRVLLVANRSGAPLPYESLMIAVGLASAPVARPDVRLLVDEWSMRLPVVGAALAQQGAVPATLGMLRRLLERDQAVVALPEGAAAVAKLFRHRYRLAPFGRATFARAAIQTGAPIVPVAVIGAEETHPVLARLDAAGRLFGLPTLPVTPTFPWLGAAGLVPLPSKWTLHFGEPLDVAARYPAADAASAAAVRRLRDQVRERLQALVLEGLRRRRWVFLGS